MTNVNLGTYWLKFIALYTDSHIFFGLEISNWKQYDSTKSKQIPIPVR